MAVTENISEKFQKLKYPVHNAKGDLIKAFPDFSRYPEFTKYTRADVNHFIRYICYVYDPGSDLHTEFADVESLKIHAGKEAGFKRKSNGEWENQTFQYILSGDFNHKFAEMVFEMIMCFITRIINRVKWTQYCSTLTQYENINRVLMGNLQFANDRELVSSYKSFKDLNRLSEELAEKLENLQRELFAGEEAVAAEVVRRTPILTPEYVATLELHPR